MKYSFLNAYLQTFEIDQAVRALLGDALDGLVQHDETLDVIATRELLQSEIESVQAIVLTFNE